MASALNGSLAKSFEWGKMGDSALVRVRKGRRIKPLERGKISDLAAVHLKNAKKFRRITPPERGKMNDLVLGRSKKEGLVKKTTTSNFVTSRVAKPSVGVNKKEATAARKQELVVRIVARKFIKELSFSEAQAAWGKIPRATWSMDETDIATLQAAEFCADMERSKMAGCFALRPIGEPTKQVM